MQLVTHQTGPGGPEGAATVDRGGRRHREGALRRHGRRPRHAARALMASSEGGMDIEEVAADHAGEDPPGAHRSRTGLDRRRRRRCRRARSAFPRRACRRRARCCRGSTARSDETDASLAEINPLIVTGDGLVIALDAKLNFDSNALYRHPEIVAMRDLDEEDPAEIEASKFDLCYISARRRHRLPGQRRRARDGDDGHDQAVRRRAGELPRRRRRRDRRKGHRGLQDHAAQPEG